MDPVWKNLLATTNKPRPGETCSVHQQPTSLTKTVPGKPGRTNTEYSGSWNNCPATQSWGTSTPKGKLHFQGLTESISFETWTGHYPAILSYKHQLCPDRDPSCHWCQGPSESVAHLFSECPSIEHTASHPMGFTVCFPQFPGRGKSSVAPHSYCIGESSQVRLVVPHSERRGGTKQPQDISTWIYKI